MVSGFGGVQDRSMALTAPRFTQGTSSTSLQTSNSKPHLKRKTYQQTQRGSFFNK